MPWDGEGRTILLPGWEVRAVRSPGSAITGDLNPHVLPASSQPLGQLPPLPTLIGTEQGRPRGQARDAHRGPSEPASSGN